MAVDWTDVGKTIGVGGALFYGVMKFFDALGDRLNGGTKKEIAAWLRVRSLEAGIVAKMPSLGPKHSLHCSTKCSVGVRVPPKPSMVR